MHSLTQNSLSLLNSAPPIKLFILGTDMTWEPFSFDFFMYISLWSYSLAKDLNWWFKAYNFEELRNPLIENKIKNNIKNTLEDLFAEKKVILFVKFPIKRNQKENKQVII